MTEITNNEIARDSIKKPRARLSLNERLGMIGLIDEGMRMGSSRTPKMADLFSDLWDLVGATVSGSKIDRLVPETSENNFRGFEINSETGENLGRLHMLYLKKPIPCYYLAYVEVASPYRKKGLGTRILEYFRDFLIEKSAVGILDNIIPEDDPTYDIYRKQAWEPIESIIEGGYDSPDKYMIYIPSQLDGKNLRKSILKLIYHIRRKRPVMDMRENEVMVQQTISEFKDLYSALVTYFEPEIGRGGTDPLMRFMFTRFTTKLIAFRRRISDLIGYTGGESLEQVVLTPEIASMPVQSYMPYDPADGGYSISGDKRLRLFLRNVLENNPSRFIEKLPNYARPSLMSWLMEKGLEKDYEFTIRDLMDLGFDPTRLKEIRIGEEDFIFERMQVKQIPELERKKIVLTQIESKISLALGQKTRLLTNPPLVVVEDRGGNAYVLRRKVCGIHWEEAIEQIHTSPYLKAVDQSVNLTGLIHRTVKKTIEQVSELEIIPKEEARELLAFFISWDLTKNYPKVIVDFTSTSLETVWAA